MRTKRSYYRVEQRGRGAHSLALSDIRESLRKGQLPDVNSFGNIVKNIKRIGPDDLTELKSLIPQIQDALNKPSSLDWQNGSSSPRGLLQGFLTATKRFLYNPVDWKAEAIQALNQFGGGTNQNLEDFNKSFKETMSTLLDGVDIPMGVSDVVIQGIKILVNFGKFINNMVSYEKNFAIVKGKIDEFKEKQNAYIQQSLDQLNQLINEERAKLMAPAPFGAGYSLEEANNFLYPFQDRIRDGIMKTASDANEAFFQQEGTHVSRFKGIY